MDAKRHRCWAHRTTLVGGALMVANVLLWLAYALVVGGELGLLAGLLALAGPLGLALALSPLLFAGLVLYSAKAYGQRGRRGRRNGALAIGGALAGLATGMVVAPISLVALAGGLLMVTGPARAL